MVGDSIFQFRKMQQGVPAGGDPAPQACSQTFAVQQRFCKNSCMECRVVPGIGAPCGMRRDQSSASSDTHGLKPPENLSKTDFICWNHPAFSGLF